MEPVPLVPDAEGNWEPLVSEIWTDVEKMSKLAETNFKSRAHPGSGDFCDHYRTARCTIEVEWQDLSAQTRLFDVDFDDQAQRARPQVGPEARQKGPPHRVGGAEQALNPTTDAQRHLGHAQADPRGARASHGQQASPWERPSGKRGGGGRRPEGGHGRGARDAAAAAEEMSAGDGDRRARLPRGAPRSWKSHRDPTQYQQLLLQQVTPLKTGV